MTAANRREPAHRSGRQECPSSGRVLVVDDHAEARQSMAYILRQAGHRVECCSSGAEAIQWIAREPLDCIVTDLQMPGMSGLDLIIQLESRRYAAQVVMVTAYASVATAVEAMRHGAFDYIEKPFDAGKLEQLVSQAIRHGRLVHDVAGTCSPDASRRESMPPLAAALEPPVMIGSSPAMQALRDRIAQVAPNGETILITGESGTGKELVARAIHAGSDRRNGPMISLNCPVLSAHLMESELFGHERGAFTGADSPRVGRFEMADGGSILLDEVTEIDLGLQAKLLRVLQEKSFERVGSSQTVRVDVRVLATTNRDLAAAVAAGRFREDLYYRLAVLPLAVPPLRQRHGDVPELVEYFLRRSAQRLDRPPCVFDRSAMDLLVDYDWPGNVRELENIVTRASVLFGGATVSADELGRWLVAGPRIENDTAAGGAAPKPPMARSEAPKDLSLEEMERNMILATLERFGGHRERTARALGIGVRTLCGKLRQYGYAPRAKTFLKAG